LFECHKGHAYFIDHHKYLRPEGLARLAKQKKGCPQSGGTAFLFTRYKKY
jgi:hypothetical protein